MVTTLVVLASLSMLSTRMARKPINVDRAAGKPGTCLLIANPIWLLLKILGFSTPFRPAQKDGGAWMVGSNSCIDAGAGGAVSVTSRDEGLRPPYKICCVAFVENYRVHMCWTKCLPIVRNLLPF